MTTKNPFNRGGGGGGGGGKPTNPFGSKPNVSSVSKPSVSAPKRNPFGAKAAPKTGLEKMREIAEQRKAGLLKVAPSKKIALQEEPTRSALAGAQSGLAKAAGGALVVSGRPPTSALGGSATQAPSTAAVQGGDASMARSAMGGSATQAPAGGGEGQGGHAAAKSAMGGSASAGTSGNATEVNDKRRWIKDDEGQSASGASVPVMTGANYTQVYQEQALGIKGAASQPVTSENYQEAYRTQSLGLEGTAAQKMTTDNYQQVYKAQVLGFNNEASDQMTGENYIKVYQKQEEVRVQQKMVQAQVKQAETAAVETKKQMQNNAKLANQAQGLYAKLALLRGALGRGPDVDAGTHAAIADVEAQLAQIPSGLR